ncbi:MAG: hypothetical protein EOP04_21725 [Proteobacteria bacterium]|nr:MAG: hypothetical protein EOP04_21725 [Pseudomonadota bacterium]
MSELISRHEIEPNHELSDGKNRALGGAALESKGFESPSIDAEPRMVIAPGYIATLDHGDEIVEYKLVGEGIADDPDEKIMSVSPTSPLGQRMAGMTVGVVLEWKTPHGVMSAEIIKVTDPSTASTPQ